MVHRYVEEPLNLLRVQVHRQNAVRACRDQQVGHQFRRDRHPRLVFAILSGIAVERQHRGDARGARPPQRVHHDEHLHQVMVGRRTGGLNDKHILAPDVLLDFHERLAVREGCDRAFAQFDADVIANSLGQRRV